VSSVRTVQPIEDGEVGPNVAVEELRRVAAHSREYRTGRGCWDVRLTASVRQ